MEKEKNQPRVCGNAVQDEAVVPVVQPLPVTLLHAGCPLGNEFILLLPWGSPFWGGNDFVSLFKKVIDLRETEREKSIIYTFICCFLSIP